MSRRRARKPCPICGKRSYRDREAAVWGANEVAYNIARSKGRSGSLEPIYAYSAHGGICWHLTRMATWHGQPVNGGEPIDVSRGRARGEAKAEATRRRTPREVTE